MVPLLEAQFAWDTLLKAQRPGNVLHTSRNKDMLSFCQGRFWASKHTSFEKHIDFRQGQRRLGCL